MQNFLILPANESIKGIINLSAIVNGFAGSPELDLAINIDSLAYKNETYGSFVSSAYYKDKLLTTEVKFSNGDMQSDKSKLVFKSTIPIDFALTQGGDLLDDQSIIISLKAEEFELSPFASAFDELTQIKGKLNADLNATGTLQNLNTTGYLNVNYASFVLGLNRLKYYAGFQLNFAGNRVDISNLYVSNSDDLLDGGTIKGNGYLVHKNFSPSEIEISVNGLLKLLSKNSRAANPTFYGDLAVETQEDMVYKFNRSQNYLSANLMLKKGANITYSPTSSAFTNETDKFVYQFKTAADSLYNKEIDSLIFISESVSKEIRASSRAPFDLDIKINVEDEVKMVFILSKEFNQDLTAYLGGNFEYVVEKNNPIAKGELVLLDGSKLNFIKTFQAEGSVKFLSELDNPYLDVTATYQNYYNPDTLGASSSEYEVQVRIKIEGPVKNLSTSFIENEDNVSVYKRDNRSGQFELDATKDASDAMFFIILGKFPEDATTQETNLVASTAASLAGSLLSSFLNERLGDIVRSVQVRQVGAETKFSLVGKVGDFRYEIGGSSQIFQDFSRANVKIEWPVVPITPLLILRLERREPVFVSRTYSEMINELGFKYSFEF